MDFDHPRGWSQASLLRGFLQIGKRKSWEWPLDGSIELCCNYLPFPVKETFLRDLSFIRSFLFATAARRASLSITDSQSLLRLMSIKLVMPSNHLILCHTLLPPSIFPSIRVFPSESALRIKWPKDWRFSISPSNEYLGLISFRMDWLDLPAVQGTLKSLLQHHSSKASVFQRSASFNGPTLISIHDYWKNHSFDSMDLCRQSSVSAF